MVMPILDPLGRPTITLFKIASAKQNNFEVKIVIATGEIKGLAEGIINDTCLVQNLFFNYAYLNFFKDT